MRVKPVPREDEWWNGLRCVDAKHMQLARFQEVGGPGARTREALTSWGIEDIDALVDRGVHVEG